MVEILENVKRSFGLIDGRIALAAQRGDAVRYLRTHQNPANPFAVVDYDRVGVSQRVDWALRLPTGLATEVLEVRIPELNCWHTTLALCLCSATRTYLVLSKSSTSWSNMIDGQLGNIVANKQPMVLKGPSIIKNFNEAWLQSPDPGRVGDIRNIDRIMASYLYEVHPIGRDICVFDATAPVDIIHAKGFESVASTLISAGYADPLLDHSGMVTRFMVGLPKLSQLAASNAMRVSAFNSDLVFGTKGVLFTYNGAPGDLSWVLGDATTLIERLLL